LFAFQPGGKAGKDSGKAKAKAVSRSARAGLQVRNSLYLLKIFCSNTQKRFYLCNLVANYSIAERVSFKISVPSRSYSQTS